MVMRVLVFIDANFERRGEMTTTDTSLLLILPRFYVGFASSAISIICSGEQGLVRGHPREWEQEQMFQKPGLRPWLSMLPLRRIMTFIIDSPIHIVTKDGQVKIVITS